MDSTKAGRNRLPGRGVIKGARGNSRVDITSLVVMSKGGRGDALPHHKLSSVRRHEVNPTSSRSHR